jgi:hypothetical protein
MLERDRPVAQGEELDTVVLLAANLPASDTTRSLGLDDLGMNRWDGPSGGRRDYVYVPSQAS